MGVLQKHTSIPLKLEHLLPVELISLCPLVLEILYDNSTDSEFVGDDIYIGGVL